jgi:hypothetical protein
MSAPVIVYATDEDVALIAPTDFALLCPLDQVLAAGMDGFFNASDPWELRSATVGFSAAGVTAGNLVYLLGPIPPFGNPSHTLGVASVTPGSVLLRRRGLSAGMGQAPGPEAGLSGVEFLVPTLAPQIVAASQELNRRLGIGPDSPGPRPEDVAASGELREATVLMVLHRRYAEQGGEANGALAEKARWARCELEQELGRLSSRWACGRGVLADRVGTRISR